jgi:hypothetical protein
MGSGDTDEALRLSSMPWAEVRRWLDDHGYSRGREAEMSRWGIAEPYEWHGK